MCNRNSGGAAGDASRKPASPHGDEAAPAVMAIDTDTAAGAEERAQGHSDIWATQTAL